jgi:hypothetical protein
VKDEPIIVERIEVHEERPTGEFKTFRIVTGSLEEEMVEGFGTGASYLMLMLGLQKEMIGMQKETLKLQRETLEEVRALRQDLLAF